MIQISKPEACCGCTACANKCPAQCIAMVENEEGFLYPEVDIRKCLNCGLCDSVCPVKHPYTAKEPMSLKAYVVYAGDRSQLLSCSSGGAVSALTKQIIDNGGYVCGAAFDENFRVRHVIANTWDACQNFRGSKYVQSDLGDVFQQIKKLLDEDQTVLFVGTGCQVRGLKLYLHKDYDKLVLIDLVCHGVPSPSVWDAYLQLMEDKYKSKIVSVNFRDKSLGYQTPSMKLVFQNGRAYKATARIDIMLKAFFRHLSIRHSCFQCPCKGVNRCSDITVFDCWNAQTITGVANNMGGTAVLAQTPKGERLIEQIRGSVNVVNSDMDSIIPDGGGMIVKSAKPNASRDMFYPSIAKNGLQAAMDSIDKITVFDYLIEIVKHCFANSVFLKNLSRARRVGRSKKKQ